MKFVTLIGVWYVDADITTNQKLIHLTYNYVKACREILKQDIEEEEREFANL